ncbi:hypothetical protein IWQ57_002767 [Coemansia nantahalensis]|uniref:Uncharacterized protein n=1 Tax=Coemansia nantahalensis TaxID=2789366 RepID=A0ACC1JZ99_9FUNG|nr:hypothetical protein IWQ57_002767 [Coemansia nantahalensis]
MAGLGRGSWGLAAAHVPALLVAGCALAALALWRRRGTPRHRPLDGPGAPQPALPAAADEKPLPPPPPRSTLPDSETHAHISPVDPVVDPSQPRRYRPSPIGRRPRTLRACQGRRAEAHAWAPPAAGPADPGAAAGSRLSLFTSNGF